MVGISSFNARNVSPEQIAKSFVMPDHFEQVAAFNNLVLVGPRGLGKTTIMKALTAPGLHHLHQRPDLTERLALIDFSYIPIYIPAETIWKGNAQAITNALDDEDERDHILNGIFVSHCLHQLVSSFEDAVITRDIEVANESFRPPWQIEISEVDEKYICNACSEFWGIERIQHSFLGLKLALLQQSNDFRSAVGSLPNTEKLSAAMALRKLDLLLMLKGFFDIVGSRHSGLRWSISFDEMEIAPKRVLVQLYDNLRSFDQRAVLKFSLFPYVDFYSLEQQIASSGNGPVDGQDFHSVILANKFASPNYSLSKQLIANECISAGTNVGDFSSYLNSSSAIHQGTRKFFGDKAFVRNYSEIHTKAIQAGDNSYADYMASKGINKAEDLDRIKGENSRAQLIRKPMPIAEIRSYYLSKSKKTSNADPRRNSPKGYGYYHGFDQILTLTEGNPRAIKYYAKDLLRSFLSGENSQVAQNRAIKRNVDRFRALVSAHTYSSDVLDRQQRSTLEFIDKLGYFLSQNLLGMDFQPEPTLSYTLKDVNSEVKDSLELAINSGAIVVDQLSDSRHLIFDLEGCRIRISHRLAPFYKLPTLTGQSRRLSNLPQTEAVYDQQPDLLNWANTND